MTAIRKKLAPGAAHPAEALRDPSKAGAKKPAQGLKISLTNDKYAGRSNAASAPP